MLELRRNRAPLSAHVWERAANLMFLYAKGNNKIYETIPLLQQQMISDFVKSLDAFKLKCVAVATAVAEFPLLPEETDLILQDWAGQVVL